MMRASIKISLAVVVMLGLAGARAAHAQVPERKSKPKKAMIAVVATLAAGFALLLFVFVRQALRNCLAVLEAAGGGAEHMVRMTWYLVDKKAYVARLKDIGAAYREVMGRHFPAMTAVQVVSLVEDRALVEIEVTAVLP